MKVHRVSSVTPLILLTFLLALLVRLWQLGAAPLTDTEARWALQALDLTRGQGINLGAQPAYLVLTAFLYEVFSSSNGMGRLLPALAGSLVCLLPLILGNFLETTPNRRLAGVIFALGVALDPGLVAVSRQAGSAMPALAFGLLALGAWIGRKPILLGICGGLALLSGPAILTGAAGLAIAFGLYNISARIPGAETISEAALPEAEAHPEADFRKRVALTGAVTLLIAGTMFFRYPQGIGAFAATLPAFFTNWANFSLIPPLRLLLALAIYQPLAVLFGVIGIFTAWVRSDRPGRLLSFWLATALLLAIVPPARQMSDLIWVLIPLWGLTALHLQVIFSISNEDCPSLWVPVVQAGFIFIMLVVLRMNLVGWQQLGLPTLSILLLVGGVALIAAIATLLVAIGWTPRLARQGLVWGLLAALAIAQIANTAGVSQLRPASALELWTPIPGIGQANLFMKSVGDLSAWHTGLRTSVAVTIVTEVDQPALEWALREYDVRMVKALAAEDQPPVVITTGEVTSLELTAGYRGQDFIWQQYPAWNRSLPDDWLRWLAFREAPLVSSNVILWGRIDIFPEGGPAAEAPEPSSIPQDQPEDIEP